MVKTVLIVDDNAFVRRALSKLLTRELGAGAAVGLSVHRVAAWIARVGGGKYRTLAIHTCEPARPRAHALAQTAAFGIAQRARRKVEALFAELKNYIGLRRLRLRRMRFVREQFYLAATVQNLKRLVRFLNRNPELQTAPA